MHWSKATTGGIDFKGVRSHTATVVGNRIFVFGGSDREENFADLLIFETDTLFWSKPDTYGPKGSIPVPQRAHSATLVGSEFASYELVRRGMTLQSVSQSQSSTSTSNTTQSSASNSPLSSSTTSPGAKTPTNSIPQKPTVQSTSKPVFSKKNKQNCNKTLYNNTFI
ncbi:hypothetical protein PPL_02486 [Heterostelium album PN500]|uniref:Uncharacterized protein n=1 Tax=Heterostelium pallidum (strain ATCC 26659 / Pp 5 / PN500) TaxID=670386 RepID=D3B278_HETP5|nr:hypothetical protein PPL_02486 [Heterostelium album PN500]EFA84453.1 hypothetical protein PPL_02486 [Heterostelium album PN500]|eukprot:XP_020436567.1 hypothetical protein PPL_02486 [Heterostelium album PN500]